MKKILKYQYLSVLVVYAMVLWYLRIIPRQNACKLIYGCTVFHKCVCGFFPKSDLAY